MPVLILFILEGGLRLLIVGLIWKVRGKSLNPIYSGRWSATFTTMLKNYEPRVLILFILEGGLRLFPGLWMDTKSICLNPIYSGRWSATTILKWIQIKHDQS